MAYLSIEKLYKSFGNYEVLKGIDIPIEKGEVVSIIGSSGSGKSTLLRCINFLETPNSGKMVLDGEVLFDSTINEKVSDKILRQKRLNFGLVFQSFNLFPQHNVIKNITLAPLLLLKDKVKEYKKQLKTGKKLSRKIVKKMVNEFKAKEKQIILEEGLALLETIGLSDKIDFYPCQLSGGQCQRVAIARALALKPKVLCFDEPTSALDPELTGEVLNVIRSLKNQDRTMIIVTHEMNFAKNVSDKIVYMSKGLVEEFGTPQEIFNNPKSTNLINFLSSVSNKDGE